ncbi:MAG: PilN domain-containing protein [Candidatus Omnitrophica bacterium]|nr:PilN domain-containing protein [Candidatus Omnitrophota bacterium]
MLALSKKLITVISVGPSRVTVAQGSGLKLDFFAGADVVWSDEQKSRDALLTLMPLKRRRHVRELCVVLPRAMFFTKLIHLPSVDEQEIRKMAALQIGQLLPYAQEQAVWDCIVCGQTDLVSDVLIVAAQREAVMKYLRVLLSAGLSPTFVTLSSQVLANLLGTGDLTDHRVLFFLDERSTEICFCLNGRFYSSRGIIYGAKDLTDGNFTDFWAQVRLTFASQRKNFPQYAAPSGLCLTRFMDNLPSGFLEHLIQESGIAWDYFSFDDFKKKLGAFSLSSQQIVDVDVLMVLAILRQNIRNMNNFLPKDFRDRHSVKAGRKNAMVLIFFILMSVLTMTLSVGAPVVKKTQQLQLLNEELERVKNPFLQLRKEQELWTAVKSSLQKHAAPLSVIQELYRIIPQGISFSKIRIGSQNEFQLEGQALQSAAVNELQEKMMAGRLLRDVRLDHTVRRASSQGEVIWFVISAKVRDIGGDQGE